MKPLHFLGLNCPNSLVRQTSCDHSVVVRLVSHERQLTHLWIAGSFYCLQLETQPGPRPVVRPVAARGDVEVPDVAEPHTELPGRQRAETLVQVQLRLDGLVEGARLVVLVSHGVDLAGQEVTLEGRFIEGYRVGDHYDRIFE